MQTHSSNKQNQTLQLNSNSITYRNAIYEGGIDKQFENRNQFGLIYMAKTHQFICCNNWHQDRLEGQTLFYNADQKYIYGTWINDLPHGFNVFRFKEVVFMTEFSRGRLPKNTKILLIFQKYNIGAILLVTNECQDISQLQFDIFSKNQVFSSDDVNSLFKMCQWPEEYFLDNQTLIKYISNKLTTSNSHSQILGLNRINPVKLRLIENKFYRFGYDQGLAVIFNEDFNRLSVGYHKRSLLKSFGIAFSQEDKLQPGKLYQTNNDLQKSKTLKANDKKESPKENIVYQTNLLMGVNFCNKFYKNPSKLFQFFIQNLIDGHFVRNLISGSLTTRKLFDEETLNFSRINPTNFNSSQIFLKADEPSIKPTFMKENFQNSSINDNRQDQKVKITQDRLRLQVIKKQIYDSLQRRNTTAQKKSMQEQFRKTIINRQIVGRNSSNNLQQNYCTPDQTLSKSRSRKRIFQQSQMNLKLLKDFTPSKSQKNLTPFKTKMKNRIFTGESARNQFRQYIKSDQSQTNAQKRSQFQDHTKKYTQNEQRIRDMSRFSSDKPQNEENLSRISDNNHNRYGNLKIKSESQKRQNIGHNNSQSDHINVQIVSNKSQSRGKQSIDGSRSRNYVPIDPKEQKMRKKQTFGSTINKQYFHSPQLGNSVNQVSYNQTQSLSFALNNNKHFRQQRQVPSIKQQNIQPGQYNKKIPKSHYYIDQHDAQPKHQNLHDDRSVKKKSNIIKNNDRKIHIQNEQNIEMGMSSKKLATHKNQQSEAKKQLLLKEESQNKKTQTSAGTKSPYKKAFQNLQENTSSKKIAFKHSNSVYLNDKNDSSQNSKNVKFDENVFYPKRRQVQNNQSPIKYPEPNKKHNMPYSLNDAKPCQKSSYMSKYKYKKALEKQIQKSPDRHRCYGNSANNLNAQKSPYTRSREYSYLFENSNLMESGKQYESPQKYTQTLNGARQNKNRFF